MNENENVKDTTARDEQPKKAPAFDPLEAAETISKGKFKLKAPIQDGEKQYDTLTYDFNALTAWELAKAIDAGTTGRGESFNLTDTQALAIFAAAAAKCTDGLDATDIRERMNAADGIAAIRVAQIFFRGSSLAGSLRFTKD